MIHTCQLEQPCYLADNNGPQIVVHSYEIVIFGKKFHLETCLETKVLRKNMRFLRKKGTYHFTRLQAEIVT